MQDFEQPIKQRSNQLNFKQVLKAYAILRNLTDDESALLETLRSLSESDREQLVESLSPGKVVKKTTKRSVKKSQRAAGIEAALKRNLPDRRPTPAEMCTYISDSGGGNGAECQAVEGDPIHDKSAGYLGYHEFDSGKSHAASAAGRSSTNGASSAPANPTRSTAKSMTRVSDGLGQSASSSGASSGEGVESAQGAAGGSSE